MLTTLIIIFRETMEAGIILGMVLAATEAIPGRTRHVLIGVGAGIAGTLFAACFAGPIVLALPRRRRDATYC